ncbi:septum formation initiator family protein [Novosphingobium sp.]|uniref:FtsB family cell division protein n=1 Tax=Novosphingobium sp. TaxID=1874826 RepID=UPI0025DF0B72|nr:septum formation initiator family protein [Novosphingobium sp.]
MRGQTSKMKLAKEQTTQAIALCCLLIMGGLALAGPSGVLAWSENSRLLDERQKELLVLTDQREELRNRVALLNPNNVDPDIAGELVRRNLNVVHPDEMVMLLH